MSICSRIQWRCGGGPILPALRCSLNSENGMQGRSPGLTANSRIGAPTSSGATSCRSGQVYMPCPPLMAGRIEAAAGGRSLRGKVGGRVRWSRPCIDLLATKWRALRKSNPHSRRSASGVPRDVRHKNLTVALMAGGRLPTAAQVGRGARSCQAYLPDTSRHTVPGIASPKSGLLCLRFPRFLRLRCLKGSGRGSTCTVPELTVAVSIDSKK